MPKSYRQGMAGGRQESNEKRAAAPTGIGTANERNKCANGKDLHSRSHCNTEEKRLQAARQRVRDAEAWTTTFPRPWAYIKDFLASEYAAGHRISLQQPFESLRHKEWSGRRGEKFGLNNDLRPVLARMILREHPEYMGKLEIRRSTALDAVMGFGGK